jgi:hypothetical protein
MAIPSRMAHPAVEVQKNLLLLMLASSTWTCVPACPFLSPIRDERCGHTPGVYSTVIGNQRPTSSDDMDEGRVSGFLHREVNVDAARGTTFTKEAVQQAKEWFFRLVTEAPPPALPATDPTLGSPPPRLCQRAGPRKLPFIRCASFSIGRGTA